MEEHRKDEHGYLCTICQQKQSEWGDLKNHMLIDHGGYLSSEFNTGWSGQEDHFVCSSFFHPSLPIKLFWLFYLN
jgi:hypothetical protein